MGRTKELFMEDRMKSEAPIRTESNMYVKESRFTETQKEFLENIVSSSRKMLDSITKEREIFFEKAVRENAIPKIKGKITKGKLRWRGIRLVQSPSNLCNLCYQVWLEQRGKRISEIFTYSVVATNDKPFGEYLLEWPEMSDEELRHIDEKRKHFNEMFSKNGRPES